METGGCSPTLTGIGDIATRVLAFLDVKDIISVALLSHHFSTLTKDKMYFAVYLLS